MTSEIGVRALVSNPALAPLARLVGEWTTTGTHPALADAKVTGRASFAWAEGGAFLVWRSEIDDDRRFPNGIAIFASDDEAGTLWISYFDERGVSRRYEITLDATGFTQQRGTARFSQRMVFAIDPNGNHMTCKGEMSRDGGLWEPDLSLSYERVR